MTQSSFTILHPIVTGMHPSDEQLPAVHHRGTDIVVTAGAGAGKTRTLVARYLSLLAEGLPPRSIVAITFTRKAAREMRNRVRQEMAAYLRHPDLTVDERDRWQSLYRQLDAARIDTIHGLCAQILRAHPVEARLDPNFEVLDEATMTILRNQAIDAAMAYAADQPALVPLYAHLTERGLRGTLSRLLTARLDAQSAFAVLPADPQPYWQELCRQAQQQALETLYSTPQWRDAVDTIQYNQAGDADDLIEQQRQTVWQAVKDTTSPVHTQIQSLNQLKTVRLSGGKIGAWSGGKQQLAEVKNALKTLKKLWSKESTATTAEWNDADDLLSQLTPLLRRLFDVMVTAYNQLKEDRNALDFDDMEQRALQTLEQHTSVRRMWQQSVTSILVDEFQDTNQRQRDLIAQLNGSRHRLFIVGDAKQSIYAFRGADVTVFRSERDRLEADGAQHISLNTSYRAHASLIRGLNELLQPVLGTEADSAQPWIEPFSPLKPYRQDSHPTIKPPYIQLQLTVGTKSAGALDRAAQALAADLIELVEDQSRRNGEEPPALGYGDVAVLCRASTSFTAYENAFEEAGIPFLTISGRGFHDRPEIRDLLNALAALSDPTDDLALAGLLRSPAIGLSDIGIYRLRHPDDDDRSSMLLWEQLLSGADELGEEDRMPALRAIELVAELHQRAGRISVADLLKDFLDRTNYRAALLGTGNWRAGRNVYKLLADAHASGIVRVNEFLEFITALRDVGTREGEARATASGAVQIMTIHAAKGLEFPVVVLGDITHASRTSGQQLVVDPQWGVVPKLPTDDGDHPSVSLAANALVASRETAEDRRLLYVAATRARERLILNGCVGQAKDGSFAARAGWIEAMGLDLSHLNFDYDPEGDRCLRQELSLGDTTIGCSVYEPYFPQVAAAEKAAPSTHIPARDTMLPPPLLTVAPNREDLVAQAAHDELARAELKVWRVVPDVKRPSAPRWVVGSLVHDALAQWRFPDAGFADWVNARARNYGLTDYSHLTDCRARVRRMLDRFQGHELCSRIDHSDEHWHEMPYTYVRTGSNQLDMGRIDCLFRSGNEWTIVDFKSDYVSGKTNPVQWTLDMGYGQQLDRYVEAVKKLMGCAPRACICLLDFSGKVHLVYN